MSDDPGSRALPASGAGARARTAPETGQDPESGATPPDGGPTYRLATIPGDGVGPEVVAAARSVLEAAGERFGYRIAWTEHLVGGIAIDTYGLPLRDEDLLACGAADAVLLGAVGGPKWDDPDARVRPEQALFALRGGLELFANLRPVSVHPALASSAPIRRDLLEGVDLLIVRELTGGLYFGRPSEERRTPTGRVAVDTLRYFAGVASAAPRFTPRP